MNKDGGNSRRGPTGEITWRDKLIYLGVISRHGFMENLEPLAQKFELFPRGSAVCGL